MSEHLESKYLLSLYCNMTLVRQVEMTLAKMFADSEVPGFIHLSVGQEAISVGIASALLPQDTLATTQCKQRLLDLIFRLIAMVVLRAGLPPERCCGLTRVHSLRIPPFQETNRRCACVLYTIHNSEFNTVCIRTGFRRYHTDMDT